MRRLQAFPPALLSAILLTACNAPGGITPVSNGLSGIRPYTQTRLARSGAGPDETAQFVYVSAGAVYAYKIKSNGALTPVPGSPFGAGGFGSAGLAIDPTGKFAYVTNGYRDTGYGNVFAYTISTSNGALTQVAGSPFAAGTGPFAVAVDPTGKFAYVANDGGEADYGNVSAYKIKRSGALTPVKGSPFGAGSPRGVAVDPQGKFAYVVNYYSNNIFAYKIKSSGALKTVKGSPFGGVSLPSDVTVDPTGKFAYVTNIGNPPYPSNVSAYTINANSGALTPVVGSPFEAGSEPAGVAVDPTGKFAYVANYFSDNVSAYTIDASTGALTPVNGSPFAAGGGPEGVAIDTTGKFAYVVNQYPGNIYAYAISAKSGALAPVVGSPFGASDFAMSIATCSVTAGRCIPPPL